MDTELDLFQMYLEEMAAIVNCDEKENQELVLKIVNGSEEAERRLIEGNLKYVLGLTRDYLNRGVSVGDLVQEANMALVQAVKEADGKTVFEDFLSERVREALQAAVESQETEKKIEDKMLARVNVLKDVSKEMAEELGREATVDELAERMKMTADEIRDIMKTTLDAMTVSGDYAEEGQEE